MLEDETPAHLRGRPTPLTPPPHPHRGRAGWGRRDRSCGSRSSPGQDTRHREPAGHLLTVIRTERCQEINPTKHSWHSCRGWSNISFVGGGVAGQLYQGPRDPFRLPLALESLSLPIGTLCRAAGAGAAVGACGAIWKAFGHQRAVAICDPENTHQRRRGDFEGKPGKTAAPTVSTRPMVAGGRAGRETLLAFKLKRRLGEKASPRGTC